tara:strand:- start:337 stop:1551 length:1215 start_codon:yes stop_codon:yes gene_type:complete
MGKHYRNKLQITPDLLIYRRADTLGDRYYARIKLGSRYVVRSLKETDEKLATEKAFEVCLLLRERTSLGLNLSATINSFDVLFQSWRAGHLKKAGKTTWLVWADHVFQRHLKPYFSQCGQLKNLRQAEVDEFWTYLEQNTKNRGDRPAVSTLRMFQGLLRAVFELSNELKLTPIKIKVNRPVWSRRDKTWRKRGSYTKKQYDKMLELAKKEIENAKTPKRKIFRTRLRLLLKFARASGLRPSELFKLQYRDVTLEKTKAGKTPAYVRVRVRPEVSKVRREREIPLITGRQLWGDLNALKVLTKATPNDLIFKGSKAHFEHFRRRHNLPFHDDKGFPLSLYSLRHLCIDQMLFEWDTPVALVARWAGTSLDMIQHYYLDTRIDRYAKDLIHPELIAKFNEHSIVD